MDGNMLRVGILGPGGIVSRVYKDLDKAEGVRVSAVGSRSVERAQKAAVAYGAEHAFGSYEELVACEDVDLVYIATPHNFHMEQAILAMEHGKHVLCEKPMALNDTQVQKMIDCAKANNVFLMEAMWTRFFPASYKLRELLKEGVIGRVRYMRSDFSFSMGKVDPNSRLFSKSLAGGALLDLGIYTMAATSMVMGYEPEKVAGFCQLSETGVDEMTAVMMQFGDGATAHMQVGMRAPSAQDEVIYGERGRIEVPNFWHPTSFTVIDQKGERTEYVFEPENEGFWHEFAHVRECIIEGLTESQVMPLKETLALSRMATEMRREWGVVYPEEEA